MNMFPPGGTKPGGGGPLSIPGGGTTPPAIMGAPINGMPGWGGGGCASGC